LSSEYHVVVCLSKNIFNGSYFAESEVFTPDTTLFPLNTQVENLQTPILYFSKIWRWFNNIKKTLGETFNNKSFVSYRSNNAISIKKKVLNCLFQHGKKANALSRENLLEEEKKRELEVFCNFFIPKDAVCCWNLYCLNKVNFYCLRKMQRLPPASLFCGNNWFLNFKRLYCLNCFFQNGLMRQKVNFKFLFKLLWGIVETQSGKPIFFFWGTTPKASSTLRWRSHWCFYH